MCFDLASMEFLESYWESSSNESSSTISCHREAESTEHYALLDTAEAHLKDYMKARYNSIIIIYPIIHEIIIIMMLYIYVEIAQNG